MSLDHSEQRAHERVAFFLIPVDREQLPVWVFLPEGTEGGQAGVIVNMSAGGIQVLTGAERPLEGEQFAMQLIVGDTGAGAPAFRGVVRRIWSQEMGKIGRLNGLKIEDAGSDAAEFLRTASPSPQTRNWVRCLLQPINAAVPAGPPEP